MLAPHTIPPIARVGPFTIGVTGHRIVEAHLGPALEWTGAHPNSHHSWRWHNQSLVTDGFDWDQTGYFLEDFALESGVGPGKSAFLRDARKMRRTRVPLERLEWMGDIYLDQPMSDVRRRLARHPIPPPKVDRDGWSWEMPGHVSWPNGKPRYDHWYATLTFTRNRLTGISLGCG